MSIGSSYFGSTTQPSYNTGLPVTYGAPVYPQQSLGTDAYTAQATNAGVSAALSVSNTPGFIPGGVAGYVALKAEKTAVRSARASHAAAYQRPSYRTASGRYVSNGARTASRGGSMRSASYRGAKVHTVKAKSAFVKSGTTTMMSGIFKAVKSSAIVSGVISLALNGYHVFKHQETVAQAGGNVVGDVASGAVGGLGGAVASAVGTAALGGVLGMGLPLYLAGIAFGIGGYMLTDHFFKKTSIYTGLTQGTTNMLSHVTSK